MNASESTLDAIGSASREKRDKRRNGGCGALCGFAHVTNAAADAANPHAQALRVGHEERLHAAARHHRGPCSA
jgi:hypothetical protein